MSTPAITTITKMLESLPEPVQERVVEHLREYLLDVADEEKWDELFRKTQTQIAEAARRVRQEIAEGRAGELNLENL